MHILADGISRYGDFAKNKDVQMLAMLAVLILQTPYTTITAPPSRSALQRPFINVLPSSIRSPRTGSLDVFTIAQGLDQQPISPALGRQSSPVAPAFAPSLSSSTSSRGSWTNIFKPGRQFVQDTLNPTSVVSTDLSLQSDVHSMSSGSDRPRPPDSSLAPGTGHRRRKDSQLALGPAIITSTSSATMSRSWTDNIPPPASESNVVWCWRWWIRLKRQNHIFLYGDTAGAPSNDHETSPASERDRIWAECCHW